MGVIYDFPVFTALQICVYLGTSDCLILYSLLFSCGFTEVWQLHNSYLLENQSNQIF